MLNSISRPNVALIFILLLFLNGCKYNHNAINPEQVKPTSNRDVSQHTNKLTQYKIVPLETFEYRYYSPDKSHYICEKLNYEKSEGEPLPVDTRLYYGNKYLDSASYEFAYEYKQRRTPAIWIDEQNVLINGLSIFNIQKMTKEAIPLPEKLSHPCHILNYRLNPGTQIMAYLAVENMGDQKASLSLWLFNITQRSWKNVYEKEITWLPHWNYYYTTEQVFWDNQANVYFDYVIARKYWQNPTTNETIEYDPDRKPAQVFNNDDAYNIIFLEDHNQVVQYNTLTSQVMERNRGYSLFDASSDGKYFIIEKQGPSPNNLESKYYVINPKTNEIITEIKSDRYAWSAINANELARVIYLDSNKKADQQLNFEIVSLINGKTVKTIKDARFNLSSGAFPQVLIDAYDHGYAIKIGDKSFRIE